MPITLTVTEGPHIGRRFSFTGHDAFLVGRSRHAHFRLPRHDMYFSRIHFLVEVNPPRCGLIDMGSTNGTFVNGRQVKQGETVELTDGDRISGGDTVIQVSISLIEAPPAAPFSPVPQKLLPPPAPLPFHPGQHCPGCGQAPPLVEGLCPRCVEQARSQPQPIAGYRILREVGRGNMGVVYLAVQQASGARVALKTITPPVAATPEQASRFLREAEILCRLRHPSIIAFHDMGESNGLLYFAMEYVPGVDAERLLQRRGPLPIAPAVALICQLLDALDHAHGQGFVHRDVKPSNLLILEPTGQPRLRLADFGLARVYAASAMSGLTLAGDMGGTVAFMPPEQITHFRDARPAADLYSTAATLYNLLTGQYVHDFPRSTHAQLELILHGEPVPIRDRRRDVPAGLAAVIHRALAKNASGRFPSARAMRAALLPFASRTAEPLVPSPGQTGEPAES
jgi:hypothetical protein